LHAAMIQWALALGATVSENRAHANRRDRQHA
jgi:hypothetical protein